MTFPTQPEVNISVPLVMLSRYGSIERFEEEMGGKKVIRLDDLNSTGVVVAHALLDGFDVWVDHNSPTTLQYTSIESRIRVCKDKNTRATDAYIPFEHLTKEEIISKFKEKYGVDYILAFDTLKD